MHVAAEENRYDIAELLIKSGADIHAKDEVCVPIVGDSHLQR